VTLQVGCSPRRAVAAALVPAAAGALALASCGGGGNDTDATRMLDKAFKQPIHSADVTLDATLKADGLTGFNKPIRIRASGPYRENPGKLPSYDIDLNVGAAGGQTISTGRVSTGDRAFVKFEDTFYEVPQSNVLAANRSLAGDRRRHQQLRGLGLDARSWLVDAHQKGDATVAGTNTTRVAGKLDVRRTLGGLNRFVARSGQTLGAAAGQVPKPLSAGQLDRFAQVVKNPSFDVYVGNNDDVIRRLSGHVELQVPKKDQASAGGLKGGTIQFSLQFANVGGNQRIQAPARARPLSDLTNSLGTQALGGGIGGLPGGGGSSATPTTPTTPRAPSTGTGGSPSAEAFKRYGQCLDKADPRDTQALQRCASLLR
jgi:hypothetical protein